MEAYSDGMWLWLGAVAFLFTATFGYMGPGWFLSGCLALGVCYVGWDTQRRRNE